jgi:signal transduction histidine kinase
MELLEQQHAIEKERGRIAKDIHDDLGSSLTRIMMLGERAQEEMTGNPEIASHVGKIVTSARSTVQSMDEIVWAINPENDTLDGLVGYISQYANQFFEGTQIRCRLEVPVDLPSTVVAAEVRHHFFLVIKEALNNVLKHSGASEVRVEVQLDAERIQVLIEDNGCGFEESRPGAGRKGNGLQNMRKRMSALGGEMSLISMRGKGTRLKCSVNCSRKGT